jgi:protein-S-isoprenylcysteine O-methyltransferase Ste14
VVPLVVLAWQWTIGRLQFDPWFAPLLAWGYLQYKLVGRYRIGRGGGGPGMKTLPDRLVTEGPYGWTRNPMYLGHLIFLAGLALTLRSELAAALFVASVVYFHVRVKKDEKRLRELFGEAYAAYCSRVKRWIPGVL